MTELAASLKPWRFRADGKIRRTPAKHGRVFVDAGRDKLLAVDTVTGEIAWSIDLKEHERNGKHYSDIFSVNTPMWLAGDRIFLHLSTSVCYCIDARHGSVVWRSPYNSYYNSYSALVMHEGVIYLGNGDGALVSLEADTGDLRNMYRPPWAEIHSKLGWQDPREQSPVIDSGPILVGRSLFFGARNGYLCRFHPADGMRLVNNLSIERGAPWLVCSGQSVLALWPRGQLGAFDSSGQIMFWRTRLRRPTTGVAANERMFCHGRGRTLLAYDAVTGSRRPTRASGA